VARADQVTLTFAPVDRDLDRSRAVVHRDAGGDPLARLDRDRERGTERRLVAIGHRLQAELVAALLGQAEADEAAAVGGHEVDRLRRRELGGDGQVAFVLPVGCVDDDHRLALANVLDRLFNRRERRLLFEPDCHVLDRTLAYLAARRSTYLARTSTSRLTSAPGVSEPSVVTSSVC